MALRIEDYAIVGDRHTAALVGKDGSIDWLCLPRFDSGACFAALLGTASNGRWKIAPTNDVRSCRRRYHDETLVLETELESDSGTVALIDFMPVRDNEPNLVRIVEGRRGRVAMHLELIIRLDYGSIVPWVERQEDGVRAIAGPDALRLRSPVEPHGHNFTTVADFTVSRGQRVPFTLTWYPSHKHVPPCVDAEQALADTLSWWRGWSRRCTYDGPWRANVLRSLITLEALIYQPTGGIVAAPTTSLPEKIGGPRNWDYRYCWLRDATFTLLALLEAGYTEEAKAWREWLLRAVAGDPTKTQIMYGLAGERRLTEWEVDWLKGYEKSRPVRIGNAAHGQFQLDVYGEVCDALFQGRKAGLKAVEADWGLEQALVGFVEKAWEQPDDGIWEVRGPRQHFTHSKVMAWVALDRTIKSAEQFGLKGPLRRWKSVRKAIHDRVCRDGFDPEQGSFVQAFGSKLLDASLLMIPLVGFLPASDKRVRGTVAAIEKHLLHDGFVRRYDSSATKDGLPPGEGAFLPCTFWLADNYALLGREDDARQTFERLLGLCNDVGLLAEEYDPLQKRLLGNFPQAFTHVGLVNTALNLYRASGPGEKRTARESPQRRV
jgi:GH15 family glucan-1,4-alpha-glucosidase